MKSFSVLTTVKVAFVLLGCAVNPEPIPEVFHPQKHNKHNLNNPALNHRNKSRYISSRKLSRQYKR